MSAADRRQVWFVGVTTGRSAIHNVFTAWARELGLDVDLVGRDLLLDATADRFRALADEMLRTEALAGAVITSHKVRLVSAARDRFVRLAPLADLLGEVSSVAVRADGLYGAATDEAAIRMTLDEILVSDHFRHAGSEALCFGVGGSARALALALMCDSAAGGPPFPLRPTRPARFHAVARRAESVAAFASVLERAGVPDDTVFVHVLAEPGARGDLVARLPEGSLIVNATGLGKDAPGSPIGPEVLLPRGAVAWDFNYRGDLEFLGTAAAQRSARGIQVHDGWSYFLHGWVEALAPILGTPKDDVTFRRFASIAAAHRPAHW